MSTKQTQTWTKSDVKNGIVEINCAGWSSFQDFYHQEMIDWPDYIWRGQRCSDWPLIPSLDRLLKRLDRLNDNKIRLNVLERFKIASRGRLKNDANLITSSNEWWALGQHFGLSTPLLDWPASPFIAAYFAFADPGEPQTDHRAVYGLSARMVYNKSKSLNKSDLNNKQTGIQFINPYSGDNPRMLNQRGLFTKAPDGVDIESWVKEHFTGRKDKWILIKILIPNKSRNMALCSLERMAISPLELFPDISGASLYCNLSITVKNYCQKLIETDMFSS
jgi:hypothetical protein